MRLENWTKLSKTTNVVEGARSDSISRIFLKDAIAIFSHPQTSSTVRKGRSCLWLAKNFQAATRNEEHAAYLKLAHKSYVEATKVTLKSEFDDASKQYEAAILEDDP